MKQRFRWTKATYKQAARLARISPIFHAYGRESDAPPLLERYFALWDRHPQHEDPLAGEHWERMWHLRRKHGPDDIPF